MGGDCRVYAYHVKYCDEVGGSMHLALAEGRSRPIALNSSFGVLFPQADLAEGKRCGTTKILVNPWVFRMRDGSFGVVALRRNIGPNGAALPEPGKEHCALFFSSRDLLSFDELGLVAVAPPGVAIADASCAWVGDEYAVTLATGSGPMEVRSPDLARFGALRPCASAPARASIDIDDAAPACEIAVTEAEREALARRLLPPKTEPGQTRWPFPLMPERGDPMAIRHGGRYLFMATDDEHGQLSLKIRAADSLDGIAGEEDHVILSVDAQSGRTGCFWAPELHLISGRLCVFFAVGSPHWYTVQSHVMVLEGEDPLDAASWSSPRRCARADGSPLYGGGITLDMTILDTRRGYYAVWAQREVGEDLGDLGTSDLYIAAIDPAQPWRLASEPVTLHRPVYGWERAHSCVCEGPFMLRRGDDLFVTYAAALVDHTYCVGLLRAEDGDDLVDPDSWRASNYPVLHRMSVPDQIGAGHNSFVKDEVGNDILLIHAIPMSHYRANPADMRRYPAFRPLLWDEDGYPRLDAESL